jgi:thymidine kinase
VAKLYFRYGAMNSGKSTALLQAAYNYEERGQRVLLAKPAIDSRGDNAIVSRLGASRQVDFTIAPDEDILARFMRERAQLIRATELAYGIRTDFQTVAFPGSRRLLEIAHSLEELKTICRCGRKAMFNARKVDGLFVFDGDQVAIDGAREVSYEPLCGACYLEESGGVLNRGRRPRLDFSYGSAPDADFS